MFFFKTLSGERFRHAVIAIALAFFAFGIALFNPLDIAVWALQSKLVDREASGDIVLVETGHSRSDLRADFNRSLVSLIEELKADGADRVFINVPLKRSVSVAADRRLREMLESSDSGVFLADPGPEETKPVLAAMRSDPYFTEGVGTFDNRHTADFLEFVWGFPRTGDDGRTTLAFALSGADLDRGEVAIDKAIGAKSMPKLRFEELGGRMHSFDFDKKTILVGGSSVEGEVRLANDGYETASVAHILAAETLKLGNGLSLPPLTALIACSLALLMAVCLSRNRKQRRAFYAVIVGAVLLLTILTGVTATHVSFANAFALLAIFGVMRGFSIYRHRHMFVDQISRAPNFSALKRDLQTDSKQAGLGIVVVKILRLDAIFADLTLREKRQYLQQISKRLALTDQAAKIYFDNGKYFALLMNDMGAAENQAHLSGLRAIASQPISVGSSSIDVSITIGADFSGEGSAEHRLSSAISAADQARETFKPVFIISAAQTLDEEWDHSLTARLNEALAQDRIKIKLQPQIDLGTGAWVGAEALARWHTQEGREIPPHRFISQCEQMGRLDDLTKRVLERSMDASNRLQQAGHDIAISVNVSAVQFVDERIAEMVEARLRKFEIDPKRLRLEITETARIEDFGTAERIMERLRSQGITFSLDDFGVGSANLEVLRKLPFEELKIDRMFVKDLTKCQAARSIVQGVLGICDGMGILSVAEGIEDFETQRLLAEMGCAHGQGYFIGKPQWFAQLLNTLEIPEGTLLRQSYS